MKAPNAKLVARRVTTMASDGPPNTQDLKAPEKGILAFFSANSQAASSPSTASSIAECGSSSSAPIAKKLKITASNGYKALHALQISSGKRVKREPSFASVSPAAEEAPSHQSGGGGRARGKLRLLPSLPLDILLETFRHLSPRDLLALARTTKPLRRTLLCRNSVSVWRDAYESIPGLPPVAPEMADRLPAWISLVFETHCQNCGTKNARTIDWRLRQRVCDKCAKTLLFSMNDLHETANTRQLVWKCVVVQKRKERKYCLKASMDAFLAKLETDLQDRNGFIARRQEEVKAIKKHAKIWEAWDLKQMQERMKGNQDTQRQRQAFIRAKLVEMGYAPELVYLKASNSRDAKVRRDVIAFPLLPHDILPFSYHSEVKQSKAITDRVWNNRVKDAMMPYMNNIRAHLKVNNQNLLKSRRLRIVYEALSDYIHTNRKLLSLHGRFLPGIVDMMEESTLKYSMIRYASPQDPEALKESTKKWLLDNEWRISHTIQVWWKEKYSYLGEETPMDSKRNDPERAMTYPSKGLQLAVIVFSCSKPKTALHYACRKEAGQDPEDLDGMTMDHYLYGDEEDGKVSKAAYSCMWYPEFLFHGCCTMQARSYDEASIGSEEHLMVNRYSPTSSTTPQSTAFAATAPPVRIRNGVKRRLWAGTETYSGIFEPMLAYDRQAGIVVNNILRACGLDWKSTTVKDMDKLNPRLVCVKCNFGEKCDGMRRCAVMSWRMAVKHAVTAHWGTAGILWERISDEDAMKAKELEIQQPKLQAPFKAFWCLECRDTPNEPRRLTEQELRDHLKSEHEVDFDSLNDDEGSEHRKSEWIANAPDAVPTQPVPVKIIPGAVPPLLDDKSSEHLPWAEPSRNDYTLPSWMSFLGLR